MRKLGRLTSLIAVLLLVSGAPADARGHGGGGGHFSAPSAAHGGGFGGHRGFEGHRFEGHHRLHDRGFIGIGPSFYWGSYWDPFWPYGPYAYAPAPAIVEPPPVYIEKPLAGYWYYCPSGGAYYPNVQSCGEPWMRVAPHTG
jgi:hypothetical protein